MIALRVIRKSSVYSFSKTEIGNCDHALCVSCFHIYVNFSHPTLSRIENYTLHFWMCVLNRISLLSEDKVY